MSFGFSVGDFITFVNLVERVSAEVKAYKDAPRHFQHLSFELYALHETLLHVLRLEAFDVHDTNSLEKIKAVALHCQQPIQAFRDRMYGFEQSLGYYRTASMPLAFRRRLHWSLIKKSDADELREHVVSQMIAINIFIGTQTMSVDFL
jgi:hypothetical protein